MPIDPETLYSPDEINAAADAAGQFLNRLEEQNEAREQAVVEETAKEEKATAELADPREKEKWGVAAFAKEGQSILSGGIQDTASSLTTFPERTIDALTGEIAKERKEKGFYRPEWDPFVDEDDPIETKTWWGKLLRGTVHFGTMAAAIIPAGKYFLARTGIQLTGMAATQVGKAALIGGTTDLISKESDGHNALGALRERYGFVDTPLTTKDTDHPVMMKVKNILEGMGIGVAFDGMLYMLKGGSDKVLNQIKKRNDSIEKQDIEKSLSELRKSFEENDPSFRAAKNRPIADPTQGARISNDIDDPWFTQKRTRTEWGAEEGSVGNVIPPVLVERVAREAAIDNSLAEAVLKELYSADKYQSVIEDLNAKRITVAEAFGDSIAAYQRITLGRDPAEMEAGEFLSELWLSRDSYQITNADGVVIDTIDTLTSKNIVTADLIIGSLLHQIRDRGIAGRELANLVDLGDIDGPASQIVDTMLVALQEVKKARIIKSDNFRQIGAGRKRQFLKEQLTKEMADTKEAMMTILKIAKDDSDPRLLNALFEVWSSMKTVQNLDDWDAWARAMLRGGSLYKGGPKRTGALLQNMGGVFTNSILSGPKTPARAIMGTSTATFLRPMATTLGAAMRYPFEGDTATLRAGLASMNAMMEAIPESFTVFRERLNSYWSGDISSVKSRYYEYTRNDDNWEILRRWAEESGRATAGDRAVFYMANIARNWNNNSWLTWSPKVMAATDDAFAHILGRAKAREKAMRSVLDIQAQGGKTPAITRELMQAYEQDFYSQIWDANGVITDEATKFARKEVTLTTPMTGFAKGLDDVFAANPWAKPFFLFARTGVSGLNLTAKHTPGFNFLVKEFNDIARATPKNLDEVAQYGITNATELANAKALQTGRLGMGAGLISMVSWAWMSGNITGNGPVDRQKRQAWIDAGYRPRQFKIGGVWVGYDSIEPFNQIMSIVADVGDASMLMGEEWTEQQLQKISLVIAQGITSKSYFTGLSQLVDLVAGKPGQQNRILAGIMNNQVPLAGLRNDLGKLFNPYMKELGSGIGDSIRNRNLISEYLPGDDLPTKYDLLNGKPIRDYDFMTRAFNMFSPISLNLDYSEGRQFLFDSGYDVRMSTYFSPMGDNLSDNPRIRSMFQKAIGETNLERKLEKLSQDPKAQASLNRMYADINAGKRGDFDASDYYHNMKIDQIFQNARKIAWARIMADPRIQELRSRQLEVKKRKLRKQQETVNILAIPK